MFIFLAQPTAVSVARTTNFTGAADPLSFLDVVVQVGEGWDRFVINAITTALIIIVHTTRVKDAIKLHFVSLYFTELQTR